MNNNSKKPRRITGVIALNKRKEISKNVNRLDGDDEKNSRSDSLVKLNHGTVITFKSSKLNSCYQKMTRIDKR